MDNTFKISSSPHVRDKRSTQSIMLDVIIALLPATVFGIINFELNAMILILTCVVSCVLFEWLYQKMMNRKVTISDLSAVVTGLLLALNLSPDVPVWMAILGSAFAIIIVKQLFGGLGFNFMNPALGARCFLLISFAGRMTSFSYDGVTTATPLAVLKNTGDLANVNVLNMFLGNICLRPSCHACHFKSLTRPSDITMGDCWGIENYKPELDDDMGASVVLNNTEKGLRLNEK